MAGVIHHDPVEFIPAMEHVLPMIAMSIELPVSHAVRAGYPDIRIAAEDHHVRIDNRRDVVVVRHRLIGVFDFLGRRWRRRA